jgi:hypothetical protein
MRDILDLATEKRLRQYIEQAHAIGINLSSPALTTGTALFAQQRSGRTSDLLEKIQSRGYWEVTIHPGRFDQKRAQSLGDLYPVLQKTSVSLRGWDFPHLDTHQQPHRDIDWIGEEVDFANRLESWRMYQSGQFVHTSGITTDWLRESQIHAAWKDQLPMEPGTMLPLMETVHRFTEIFEFAARLALTDAYIVDDQMRIEVLLSGLEGRHLHNDIPGRLPFAQSYVATLPAFPQELDARRDDLVATAKEQALDWAEELFLRFGWEPSRILLQDIQALIGHY